MLSFLLAIFTMPFLSLSLFSLSIYLSIFCSLSLSLTFLLSSPSFSRRTNRMRLRGRVGDISPDDKRRRRLMLSVQSCNGKKPARLLLCNARNCAIIAVDTMSSESYQMPSSRDSLFSRDANDALFVDKFAYRVSS